MYKIFLTFFILFTAFAYGKETSPFPEFNPNTVTEIKGTVLSIQKISLVNKPQQPSLQLVLHSKDSNINVELGPEWFLNAQGIYISSSDQVEIKGSLVKINSSCLIIASEIKVNNSVIKMRDDKGNPLWLHR